MEPSESVLKTMDRVDGIAPEDVWLPDRATEPNGTGLGLTIVDIEP